MDFSNLTLQLDLDNCDILSQTDSQLSDRDADILEQQVGHLIQKNQNIEGKLINLEYTKSNVFKTISRILSSSVTVSKGVF